MFQIGEFSFVLARVGIATNSIGHDQYALVLTAAIVTMAFTPIVSGQTARIYALRKRWFRHEPLDTANMPDEGLCDHVVIVGGGHDGFLIAGVLSGSECPCEMTRQTLVHPGIPAPEIQRHTEALRRDLVAPFLAGRDAYRTLSDLRTAEHAFELEWVSVTSGSRLVHRTISDSQIRTVTGVSVVGVMRAGALAANPEADFQLLPEDLVAIIGTDAARRSIREFAALEGTPWRV